MNNEILEVIANAKKDAEADFTIYFLKNIAIYNQLKFNFEFEIERLSKQLPWVLYHRASLGKGALDLPNPPNGGGTCHEDFKFDFASPNQFDLINIFQIMANHKGLISKLGFEVYYLTEVSKLQDEVFRLKNELKEIEAEIIKVQEDIDAYGREEEVKEQRRRTEEYAKAERLKARIVFQATTQSITEEEKAIFQKSYKNLGTYAKEHLRRIAPEYEKFFLP